MYKRDYILKMVQQIYSAIARLLNDDDRGLTERQKDVEAMYSMFGGDADYFRSADVEEILRDLTKFEDDYAERVEMLAEVMYADARLFIGNYEIRRDIIAKSLALYNYADEHFGEYSIERIGRMAELQEMLKIYQ